MQIIWNGENSIKIISENNIILLNPKKVEQCSLVIDPKDQKDFAKIKDIFTIVNYGEYEVKDDFVYKNFIEEDGEKKEIYRLDMEDINVLNLNNISKELVFKEDEEAIEGIIEGNFDILLIPIGEGFLSTKTAIDLKNSLSPKIVIPINYDPIKDEKALREFKASFLNITEADKFKIAKKNLPQEESVLYILKAE